MNGIFKDKKEKRIMLIAICAYLIVVTVAVLAVVFYSAAKYRTVVDGYTKFEIANYDTRLVLRDDKITSSGNGSGNEDNSGNDDSGNSDYLGLTATGFYPGMEEYEYLFDVTNGIEGESYSDIDMGYNLRIRTMRNLPLTYILYYDGKTYVTGEPEKIELSDSSVSLSNDTNWYEYSFYERTETSSGTDTIYTVSEEEAEFTLVGGAFSKNEFTLGINWFIETEYILDESGNETSGTYTVNNEASLIKEVETMQIKAMVFSKESSDYARVIRILRSLEEQNKLSEFFGNEVCIDNENNTVITDSATREFLIAYRNKIAADYDKSSTAYTEFFKNLFDEFNGTIHYYGKGKITLDPDLAEGKKTVTVEDVKHTIYRYKYKVDFRAFEDKDTGYIFTVDNGNDQYVDGVKKECQDSRYIAYKFFLKVPYDEETCERSYTIEYWTSELKNNEYVEVLKTYKSQLLEYRLYDLNMSSLGYGSYRVLSEEEKDDYLEEGKDSDGKRLYIIYSFINETFVSKNTQFSANSYTANPENPVYVYYNGSYLCIDDLPEDTNLTQYNNLWIYEKQTAEAVVNVSNGNDCDDFNEDEFTIKYSGEELSSNWKNSIYDDDGKDVDLTFEILIDAEKTESIVSSVPGYDNN